MIQTAVVGAGHIAREHIACVRELPGVHLAGVCDLSPALAESAAERFAVTLEQAAGVAAEGARPTDGPTNGTSTEGVA